MGLGSIAVSPLEMASAYATLRGGRRRTRGRPASARSSSPTGTRTRGAGWGIPTREQVIPDWVAGEVTRILRENVQQGTGVAANYEQYVLNE